MPIGAFIAIGESPVHFHDDRFMSWGWVILMFYGFLMSLFRVLEGL